MLEVLLGNDRHEATLAPDVDEAECTPQYACREARRTARAPRSVLACAGGAGLYGPRGAIPPGLLPFPDAGPLPSDGVE